MGNHRVKENWRMLRGVSAVAFGILALLLAAVPGVRGQANPTAPKVAPAVGTIKAINGNLLTLTTDSGTEVKVQLSADVRYLRIPPGSKDLKEATGIQLSDLQPGDRVLVRGKLGEDGLSLAAVTLIAMKKADIAEVRAKEREEWQRHGIGGLVKTVDVTDNAITISTLTATGPKDVVIHVAKDTVLRRYAPGSIKFDDAKTAPITEILAGDQLRARGSRSAGGNEFNAQEIVSGSFRNIAGTITAVDAKAGMLTVSDIATKKQVQLMVTADSQLRNVPQPMAQRIAIRLKGVAAEGNGNATTGEAGTAHPPAGGPPPGGQAGAGNAPGSGAPPRNGGGDVQQILSRLPGSPLSDFQKGDVVMIVATGGQGEGQPTVITLLGGVEPILQATTQGQASSILSPWSLNQGGAADMGTP